MVETALLLLYGGWETPPSVNHLGTILDDVDIIWVSNFELMESRQFRVMPAHMS